MGFMREINKSQKTPIEGWKNVEKNVGLQYNIAGIIDGDVEALSEVLDAANKGRDPRITRKQIDEYIDSEDTDIDGLFEKVLDFLKLSNATRKVTMNLLEMVEKQKAEAANS
jgi:hypothetical protein